MSWREWLGGLAILEVVLICIAIRTGWHWHRTKRVRRFLSALRASWRRVLTFAFCGWMVANVAGVLVIIVFYEYVEVNDTTDAITEAVAITLPLIGVSLGAVAGYATSQGSG